MLILGIDPGTQVLGYSLLDTDGPKPRLVVMDVLYLRKIADFHLRIRKIFDTTQRIIDSYHPDHLGSSSWITFSDGSAVQHLHYLPWGEDFVDQRNTTWNAMYTFSAKEKDTETGLSYFGSRYYSSDLSVWLSVDPMAGKYPSLSPYTYCADNPVKLVDPNGEEFVDGDGNRVRVRVLKDGTIQYKFSRKTSDATKSEFISNHNESLSALAKTKSGRKCIRFLNNCYTSVSISPTEESGKQNSLVIPSSDENGNVEINDGVYENVVIKPFMGTIRNKASRDNVDVDEILGATLIVEAGHLKKSQISKDYNDNLTEESKYYQLYNQYVDYRYNYRKEMGQPVDETVFNNSANINPRLNRINSKRKKQYGQN